MLAMCNHGKHFYIHSYCQKFVLYSDVLHTQLCTALQDYVAVTYLNLNCSCFATCTYI